MTRLKAKDRRCVAADRETCASAFRSVEFQATLRSPVLLEGVGVHSGKPARLSIYPAEADAGVSFARADCDAVSAALWSNVCATELCTSLRLGAGAVATVEHVMAALAGLAIDNAHVEIDGPEAPVLDGSAVAIVEAIDEAGVRALPAPRRRLEILKTVRVERGAAFAELSPAEGGLTLDVEIDFTHAAIGRQRKRLALDADSFRRELSRARTFGFLRDIERLWRAGFALGASFENSIAIGEDGVLNPGGLRYRDEFVRHKMLDAVGDLALAGAPISGLFRSRCGGHALNHAVLQALFADRSSWRLSGVQAARRGEVRPDIGRFTQLALAPERS
ncbi:MAG: UDP-3-O-acyl-N-acetylglucosamine deacetylase [Hyphomicrobiales bacterium]|nr:UDP-3-O-acyl-N-acetylglucosamine deacetylase [Hyphomicrobiales bacterium]